MLGLAAKVEIAFACMAIASLILAPALEWSCGSRVSSGGTDQPWFLEPELGRERLFMESGGLVEQAGSEQLPFVESLRPFFIFGSSRHACGR